MFLKLVFSCFLFSFPARTMTNSPRGSVSSKWEQPHQGFPAHALRAALISHGLRLPDVLRQKYRGTAAAFSAHGRAIHRISSSAFRPSGFQDVTGGLSSGAGSPRSKSGHREALTRQWPECKPLHPEGFAR